MSLNRERDDISVQGSTGVLKTSRLPTWVVNFGVGFRPPKIPAGCPLVAKFLCGHGIAHAAAECIAASLSSRKYVSTAMFTDPVQPRPYHHRHRQQP